MRARMRWTDYPKCETCGERLFPNGACMDYACWSYFRGTFDGKSEKVVAAKKKGRARGNSSSDESGRGLGLSDVRMGRSGIRQLKKNKAVHRKPRGHEGPNNPLRHVVIPIDEDKGL